MHHLCQIACTSPGRYEIVAQDVLQEALQRLLVFGLEGVWRATASGHPVPKR